MKTYLAIALVTIWTVTALFVTTQKLEVVDGGIGPKKVTPPCCQSLKYNPWKGLAIYQIHEID